MTAWTDRSDNITELAAAWVAATRALEMIPKTRKVSAGPIRYSYADLGDVLATAMPILGANNLLVTQSVDCSESDVLVTTTMLHASGQFISSTPVRMPIGKTAQNTGSSITYARRYGLMAFLGLATEDDDGASASPRREQQRSAPQPPQPRSDEEAQIRRMLAQIPAADASRIRSAFIGEFGSSLAELEPSLHSAALLFVESLIEADA